MLLDPEGDVPGSEDYAVLVLLLNSVGFFISIRLKCSDGSVWYQFGTSSQRAH